MRNYFIYNGVDSRDYGVYISGQGTFNAPQKAYQFYNIPGRNGALIGYDKRFENVNITYQAFIYKDFEKNLANFRSFLLSVNGYARLEDSYHPDEFRAAAYVGPFDPEVTSKNDAGSFTITFNCKPQRYLKSGETQYTWGAGTLTAKGSALRLYGPNIDTTSLTIDLPLKQAGSGTPSPSNPRPITIYDGAEIKVNNASWYSRTFSTTEKCAAGSLNVITGVLSQTWIVKRVPSTGWTDGVGSDFYNVNTFMSGVVRTSAVSSHMKPYEADPPSPPFPYRSLEFEIDNQGKLQIWSDRFKSVAALESYLAANEVYVAAKLSSAASYSVAAFTPVYPDEWIDIKSNGEVTVSYLDAIELVNPTPFAAKPIIRVNGTGVFTLNDVTVTISSAGTYTDIDCELMDCYEGSSNRNQYVSFSTYDFPELKAGSNTVIGSTITTLYILPRWWRL